MAGRVLAFADAEVIRMAQEEFVPVVGDDWYQRRRQDAEGQFFRKVSDAAGRGDNGPSGGSTRQGIYCLTASGKLLAFKNAGNSPEATRGLLQKGLASWKNLPTNERQPHSVEVPPLKADARYAPVPPPGCLILDVYTRPLERDSSGDFRIAPSVVGGVNREAQQDHLWLTESEWQALVPADVKRGQQIVVPEQVRRRILQYHLVDSTLGEPVVWVPEEVRSEELTVTVEETSDRICRLRLDGEAVMATAKDLVRAERGFEARLLGQIVYDREHRRFDRFDVVALGDAWGKNPIYGQSRSGRMPLGVAFCLTRGDGPADRVPPQAARWLQGYLEAR